MKMSEFQN